MEITKKEMPAPEFMRYPSRRSVVYSTHGMVACTQPLAAQAGIRVLREGGNAAVGVLLRIFDGDIVTDGGILYRMQLLLLVNNHTFHPMPST